jgi:uncharacterized protein (DUF2141 family)
MSFRKTAVLGVLSLIILLVPVRAQVAMGFVRYDSIPVSDGSQLLTMAWGGGMDMLQYSEIDLDQDGIKDLFVFDRSGNKITTYINTGTPNQVSYVLAPQYVYSFPVLNDWALLRDYNCDGKEDIFTATIAGIRLYKNTSSMANGIQFQMEVPLINTNRSPNSTNFIGNLFVSFIDLPAIRDVDGDGDLDILTFQNGGPQIEYHVNMSMELYGVCDSVEYEVRSNCWGEITENGMSAAITLNTGCLPVPLAPHNNEADRMMHTGSCLECFNFDGDTVQDLLIGDVGSQNVAYVHNSTWPDSAVIDYVDATYPVANVPVNMELSPCPAHIDVNNDGKRDLLFSGAAPTYTENKTSSLFYMNTGSNIAVQATFIQNDFLQENMIDVGEGCYPVLYDYDTDGDKDLLIGNRGYHVVAGPMASKIALYINNGTPTNPSFIYSTDDFASVHANNPTLMNLAPTFGDLDGDGDKDMLIGDYNGELHYFQKGPGPGNFTLVTPSYQGIDVGEFAAPFLYDVDGDNKIDLLVGEDDGKVRYYQNTGSSAAPVFTFVTATFGGINVCQPGWYNGASVPFMFDDNGSTALVVGSYRGWVYRYDNIDANLAGTFTLTDSLYISWREGGNVAAVIDDLNGDGLYDAIVGNYAGGVSFFKGDNNVSTSNLDGNSPGQIFVYPNPANEFLTLKTDFIPDDNTVYELHNAAGSLSRQGRVYHQQTTIDCTDLGTGVYILSVTTPKGILHRKVVITHQ